jgi:hypothetical protein
MPDIQQMIVFRKSGLNGFATPWATGEEARVAAAAFCAEVNAASGDTFAAVEPSNINPGEKFAVEWDDAFRSATPAATPPEGSQQEDVSDEWYPLPE